MVLRRFTDMMGRHVELAWPPQRIVSLVPSQTELLADLGLEEEVVGITKFCVHPNRWFRNKTRIGGTKQLHTDRIRALQPDLIIGNKEENLKEQIAALAEEFPVWMSDVKDFDSALDMIGAVGQLVGRSQQALQLRNAIWQAFAPLRENSPAITAAYFIWRRPWMVAGAGTFINDMMRLAGFKNAFDNYQRYPVIGEAELKAAQPQLLLLSSEPYPFKKQHADELCSMVENCRAMLVDGEMFSWYGSRMLKAANYLANLRWQKPVGRQ